MDPTRFDALARALSGLNDHLPSRRGLLQALGAGLIGLAAERHLETEAKKGRGKRRRKAKRKCLFGQRRCRDKRCHGCCSDKDCGGNVCESGTCSDCPRNQRLCRDGCIPQESCCADSECTGGRVCAEGACECGPNRRLCDGVCIDNDECCGTDCPINTCTPETCDGCCDGTACREGDSQNNCGRDGLSCQQCVSGEVCDAGACRPSGQTCTPENCNGCCDGDTCREGSTQNFCGRNGVTCAQCGRDSFCNAGQCDCPAGTTLCPDGDCIAAGGCCTAEDCGGAPGGLCRPDHVCVYPPLCGGTGDACPTSIPCCSDVCDQLQCQPGDRFRPCQDDGDCATGLTCRFYVCEQ